MIRFLMRLLGVDPIESVYAELYSEDQCITWRLELAIRPAWWATEKDYERRKEEIIQQIKESLGEKGGRIFEIVTVKE